MSSGFDCRFCYGSTICVNADSERFANLLHEIDRWDYTAHFFLCRHFTSARSAALAADIDDGGTLIYE
jgi:hypothetical protein